MIELNTVKTEKDRTRYTFFTSRTKIRKSIIISVLENENNKGKVEVSWHNDLDRCFDNYEAAILWHTFTPVVVAALKHVCEHEQKIRKIIERETTPEPRTQTQTSP